MRYTVVHRTEYEYASHVSLSQHLLHLYPRSTPRQTLTDFTLSIDPTPASRGQHIDFYGNTAEVISFDTPYDNFVVTSCSVVDVSAPILPAHESTPPWETSAAQAVRVRDHNDDGPGPGEFLFDSTRIKRSPIFREYARKSFTPGRPFLVALHSLTGRIYREFRFDPEATHTSTPVEEAFRARAGVCQDFAHIAISCLRSIGVPARYVSGYLETIPPPGKKRLAGADASHAWVAAWCPGLGWIDTDPTNNMFPGERHITIGWGRDFYDVSPIRGVVVGGGEHEVKVGVDVIGEGKQQWPDRG